MHRSISSWRLRASAAALASVSVVVALAPPSQGDMLDPGGVARAPGAASGPTASRDSGRRSESGSRGITAAQYSAFMNALDPASRAKPAPRPTSPNAPISRAGRLRLVPGGSGKAAPVAGSTGVATRRTAGESTPLGLLPSTVEAAFLYAGPFGPRHERISSQILTDEPEWYAAACARSDLSFVAGDARLVGVFASAGRRSQESSLVRLMTWYAEAEKIALRTPQPMALRNEQAALGADAVAASSLAMAGTEPARY